MSAREIDRSSRWIGGRRIGTRETKERVERAKRTTINCHWCPSVWPQESSGPLRRRQVWLGPNCFRFFIPSIFFSVKRIVLVNSAAVAYAEWVWELQPTPSPPPPLDDRTHAGGYTVSSYSAARARGNTVVSWWCILHCIRVQYEIIRQTWRPPWTISVA